MQCPTIPHHAPVYPNSGTTRLPLDGPLANSSCSANTPVLMTYTWTPEPSAVAVNLPSSGSTGWSRRSSCQGTNALSSADVPTGAGGAGGWRALMRSASTPSTPAGGREGARRGAGEQGILGYGGSLGRGRRPLCSRCGRGLARHRLCQREAASLQSTLRPQRQSPCAAPAARSCAAAFAEVASAATTAPRIPASHSGEGRLALARQLKSVTSSSTTGRPCAGEAGAAEAGGGRKP